jgi:hypothetical protein
MSIYMLYKLTTRAALIILGLTRLGCRVRIGECGEKLGEAEAPEADTIKGPRDHDTSQGYTASLAYRG